MSEYSSPTNFIDLKAQQDVIRLEIDNAIKRVLDHGQYIMGPEVREFENILKNFSSSKHVLTCANGTDALTLVLMAWGIGPGDAVFVPSFSYVSTAETVAQVGATPFFVDVDLNSFNMKPESLKQALIDIKLIDLEPKAIIPVDLFGQPSEIDSLTKIAKKENLKILIDGAQSFGAVSKGRKVGSMGDATTTSFFPAKPLGCYGDGGAIFTDNDELASLINSIRLHGKGVEKYDNVRIGLNSRLDTIQAAVLIEKMKIFPQELIDRDRVASIYSENLKEFVDIPAIDKNHVSAWAQYTLKTNHQYELKSFLENLNIPTQIYYPKSLSQQSGYKNFPSVSSGLKNSDSLPKKVLSLPMHPYLKDETVNYISEKVIDFFKN